MEDWRGLFRERFVIEENTEEQYLRKHDHRTIVEELEHFIEQEIEKAREEGREDTLKEIKEIMESHIENDTSTYEIIELLLNEYDGSGMKVSN